MTKAHRGLACAPSKDGCLVAGISSRSQAEQSAIVVAAVSAVNMSDWRASSKRQHWRLCELEAKQACCEARKEARDHQGAQAAQEGEAVKPMSSARQPSVVRETGYQGSSDPGDPVMLRQPQLRRLPPLIPMRYTARIETHYGWWFRYQVVRRHGIGIPENEVSLHRTLRGARRAAARWCKRNEHHDDELVEEIGTLPVIPDPPPAPPADSEVRG